MNEATSVTPFSAAYFSGTPDADAGQAMLLSDTGAGNFTVRLTLTARRNAAPADAFVFLGHRTLAAAIPSFKGSCEVSGTVHVGARASGRFDSVTPGQLALTLLAPSLFLSDCRIAETDVPTVHLTGSDLVADEPADLHYDPFGSPAGWGQMLPYFLSGRFAVANHAVPGTDAAILRDPACRSRLLEEFHPGDFVLLQFGHPEEDGKNASDDTPFREQLGHFIGEIRARDALPVLITPPAGNTFSDGGYVDLQKDEASDIIAVGERSRVPVLELHARTVAVMEQNTKDKTAALFLPADPSPTNDAGAFLSARIIASELKRVCGWADDYQALAQAVDRSTLRDDDPAAMLFLNL
ncbi:MAG: hypothetical protein K5696_09420 [Lachnospiraceae bacterium]|nr:hypothetical protein [Lachnospiraceae bacterium]